MCVCVCTLTSLLYATLARVNPGSNSRGTHTDRLFCGGQASSLGLTRSEAAEIPAGEPGSSCTHQATGALMFAMRSSSLVIWRTK